VLNPHLQEVLDIASKRAFEAYREQGEKIAGLPRPFQVVATIYAAQGVIDNGALQYFYEANWPEEQPYSYFVDVYRTIGALNVADCIEKTAAMFPFPDPHLHREKRNQFLGELESEHEFFKYAAEPAGDDSVWEKLAEYVSVHMDEFRDRTGGGIEDFEADRASHRARKAAPTDSRQRPRSVAFACTLGFAVVGSLAFRAAAPSLLPVLRDAGIDWSRNRWAMTVSVACVLIGAVVGALIDRSRK
jgi:hypothetical protein